MSFCVRMSVCPESQASVFLAKQDTSGTQLTATVASDRRKKQTSAQSSYLGRSISVKRVNFRVRGFHLVLFLTVCLCATHSDHSLLRVKEDLPNGFISNRGKNKTPSESCELVIPSFWGGFQAWWCKVQMAACSTLKHCGWSKSMSFFHKFCGNYTPIPRVSWLFSKFLDISSTHLPMPILFPLDFIHRSRNPQGRGPIPCCSNACAASHRTGRFRYLNGGETINGGTPTMDGLEWFI